jgi:hypothetical protein
VWFRPKGRNERKAKPTIHNTTIEKLAVVSILLKKSEVLASFLSFDTILHSEPKEAEGNTVSQTLIAREKIWLGNQTLSFTRMRM